MIDDIQNNKTNESLKENNDAKAVSNDDAAFSSCENNDAKSEKNDEFKEYDCALKVKKNKFSLKNYKYYNKGIGYRFLTFLHRVVANIFLRLYLKIFYHVKVEGKKFVKPLKKKGIVVVSNHIHPLDMQAIMVFVFGLRKVHFFSLLRNFDFSIRFFLRNSGAVPIPLDRDSKKICYNEMNQMLKENGVLYICPEGSLVKLCEEIRPFAGGAFRFATQNDTPLLPITLRFKTHRLNGKKYRFPRFTIVVSKPLYPSEHKENLQAETEKVMKKNCTKSFNESIE